MEALVPEKDATCVERYRTASEAFVIKPGSMQASVFRYGSTSDMRSTAGDERLEHLG
ncbi:hypothetical protein ACVW1C_001057 [Bradyrhizobium sp. USDA 4011]